MFLYKVTLKESSINMNQWFLHRCFFFYNMDVCDFHEMKNLLLVDSEDDFHNVVQNIEDCVN